MLNLFLISSLSPGSLMLPFRHTYEVAHTTTGNDKEISIDKCRQMVVDLL